MTVHDININAFKTVYQLTQTLFLCLIHLITSKVTDLAITHKPLLKVDNYNTYIFARAGNN